MKCRLSQFERRMKILSRLLSGQIIKRSDIAQEFSVSNTTISDDLLALNNHIPIDTKRGPYGGYYLSPIYDYGRKYLSVEETAVLKEYMNRASKEHFYILQRILHKFSMPK